MLQYKIICYAYKVKTGQWDLESIENGIKPVVPENYRNAVADYLLQQSA